MKTFATVFLLSATTCAAFGQVPAANSFQYAAKFVCGTPAASPSGALPTLAARGRYFSQTNVHNPSRFQTVSFRKKFAVAEPFERAGVVSKYFDARLQPDEALQIDCGDVFQHLQIPSTSYVEGFAVIESPLELDVDTVYTAGTGAAFDVSSIHTERVAFRLVQGCNPLNLNLTSGVATWQVVNEQLPAGSLPRVATTYGNGLVPGSKWIGALPTNKSNVKQWWDFQICFCLCTGAQNVKLNLTGAAIDDTADFTLNGNPIGQLAWTSQGTVSPASLTAINNNASAFFRTGDNCLKIRLTNVSPDIAQLDLAGSITGTDAACPASR